jgi:hypothetical protein
MRVDATKTGVAAFSGHGGHIPETEAPMLEHLIAVLLQPDEHLCTWRDGELHIRPPPGAASSETSLHGAKEKIAA